VWDNALTPALEIDSGETVQLETADASGGQLNPESSAADVAALDFGRVNPVTGPVFVRGAQPGDVLAVEILEMRAHDWGWTAIIPGFGLLADEFAEPWLRISQVDPQAGRVRFADGITLPFEPFPGTIGVAPAEPGQHSVVPPRRWGGNMDIKHLRPGSTLYLPVGVEGALFSVGDTHAAMGDGLNLQYPQYDLPAGQLSDGATGRYHVCTGIHEDLMEATREATRQMVQYITRRYERDRQEAYAIASVAVDLRIHEVVDVPNWVVGAFLPEAIFDDS
jgi:acetamidase/formamidase